MRKLLLIVLLLVGTLSSFAQSNITVFSSNPDNSYTPGETLTFTLMITNNGPQPAQQVNVFYPRPTDIPIPPGVTKFWWTGSNGSNGTNVDLNNTIFNLAVNQTVTYTIHIKIPDDYVTPLADVRVTWKSRADIEVVNTDGTINYTPGTQTVYTVTVTNHGIEEAFNIRVQNAIPAGITAFSWTGSNGSSGTNVPLDNIIRNLPVGEVVTYTITVDVPATFTGPLTSTTTYTANLNDPTPDCTQCTDIDYSSVGGDLVVTNTNAQTVYTAGQVGVAYTITVTNNGPDVAEDVVMAFTLPVGVTVAAWTGTNASAGALPDLDDAIGDMAPGASVTYTLTLNIPAGHVGDFVVDAAATSTTNDPDPSCLQCRDTDYATASADIVVVNTNNQVIYTPGANSTYTITVTNNGPTDAVNVAVDNAIPAGITAFSWTGSNASSGTNVPLDDTIPVLHVGETVTYTIILGVPAGYTGPLTSQAAVTTPTPDPVPGCTTCIDTDYDAVSADLVTTKTLNTGTTFTPGTDAVYTITVTNNGPSAAANVTVSDIIPAGIVVSDVTWTGSNGTSGTGNLTDVIPAMAVGEVVTYTLTMPVPSGYPPTSNLVNRVLISSDTPDPTPICAACVHSATPTPSANLVTIKTNGQTEYIAGEEVVYTITITNQGPSDAFNIVVNDPKPNNIIYMQWEGNGDGGLGTMNDNIAVLPAGESIVYTVTLQVEEDHETVIGPLINRVNITSGTPDPSPTCPLCEDRDTPRRSFVTTNRSEYSVQELVEDVLIGLDCVQISNITSRTGTDFGQPGGIGYFNRNNSNFTVKEGIILHSGDIFVAQGPGPTGPGQFWAGLAPNPPSWSGDAQLFNYIQGLGIDPGLSSYNDATVLEFDFVPLADNMSFDFVFASTEYGIFQCGYADAFAFFLTHVPSATTTNIAIVPATTTPISVLTIRDCAFNVGQSCTSCPSQNETWFGDY